MTKPQMTRPQIRALIVEDDLVDRMACRRALGQDPDYEFVLSEAETGRKGLQLAHAQKLDCILLDYHLPDLNGMEFLTKLRTDLGEMPVPVMMLTGADNASVAVEAMKLGAQDYLVKDVNRQYLELLSVVIQRVLRERQTLMEKKQAEENLLQAEAKFRFLVEHIPAIIYTSAQDAPGNLLYISPQISQLGFTAEEWLADPEGALKQVHPEDKTLVHEEIARSYRRGESLRCEYRLLTRDGKVRWFLNEGSLMRHETGKPLFLQGVLVDITEAKKVEEELQQHRRRLQELVALHTRQYDKQNAMLASANTHLSDMLVECKQERSALKKNADQFADLYHNAPCSYYSLDADGVFVQINDTALKYLGRTREDVVGKMKFTDLLTPASVKTFVESFQCFKESGWMHDLKLEIEHKDGTKLSVLLNANAIKDATDRFVMSRSMMFEITDRKGAE